MNKNLLIFGIIMLMSIGVASAVGTSTELASLGTDINALTSNGNGIIYVGLSGSGLGYYSISDGWIDLSISGIAGGDVLSLSLQGAGLFTGMSNGILGQIPNLEASSWSDKNIDFGTSNINALVYDDYTSYIFIGGTGSQFGYYDFGYTDLSYNLQGTEDILSLASDNGGLIFVGTTEGFWAYSSDMDDYHTAVAHGVVSWANTKNVTALVYDSNNDKVYTGSTDCIVSSCNPKQFGVYQHAQYGSTWDWIDLSATDDGWADYSGIKSLAYDSINNLVYTGLENGKFGVYSPDTGIWSDLSSSDTGDWIGTSNINALVYDITTNLVYLGMVGGKFGVYDSSEIMCTPDWSCSSYSACQFGDTQSCIAVTDLNTCGVSYAGDYSEIAPQSCDFCTPVYQCSGYGECQFGDVRLCSGTTDLMSCVEHTYSGNMSEFTQSCSFCIENWTQIPPTACNGILNNFNIHYGDVNNCGTYVNLPVNNGTVIDCCVESWVSVSHDCITYQKLISYTDNNACGTSYRLPANNGTSFACGSTSGGGSSASNMITGGATSVPSSESSVLVRIWHNFVDWIKGLFN